MDGRESSNKKNNKLVEILKVFIVSAAVFFAFIAVNYIIQSIVAVIIVAIVTAQNPNLSTTATEDKVYDILMDNMSLLYFVISLVFILAFILIQRKTKFSKIVNLEFKKPATPSVVLSLLLGSFIGVVANTGVSLISKWLPPKWIEANQESVEVFTDGNEFIMLLAVVICAPIIEEIIFRGFIYNGIKKIFYIISNSDSKKTRIQAVVVSAIISSALFGIYHGNILQAIYTGLLSLAMVWIYEMTGSIISSMLVHCMFNFAGTPTYYLVLLIGEIPALIVCAVLMLITFIFTYRLCRIKVK